MDPPVMDRPIEDQLTALLDADDVRGAATLALKSYGPQIFGYLMAVLRRESAADEAFAEFSEALWTGLGGFRRECSVKTFAYKLAWHAALRILRDPYNRRGRRLESAEALDLVQSIRSQTAMHLRSEVKDRMSELRESLSTEEQTLLILRINRQLSWREVAEVLGVAEPVVRKRFERTKDRLRQLARAAGLVPDPKAD
jgi:RNA polymerase sigma-70 factor (ECF subfamily)